MSQQIEPKDEELKQEFFENVVIGAKAAPKKESALSRVGFAVAAGLLTPFKLMADGGKKIKAARQKKRQKKNEQKAIKKDQEKPVPKKKFFVELWRGIFKNNAIFCILLGLCPTLAVTTTLENSLGMGIATLCVLVASSFFVSSIRKIVPDKIRLPVFIVIIATFVTIIDLLMKGFTPELSKRLGIFIPLIVVNCVILGRAEAYASKNTVKDSVADALGVGFGFILALAALGIVRELLGSGGISIGGVLWVPTWLHWKFFTLPAGGFLILGLMLGLINHIKGRRAAKACVNMPAGTCIGGGEAK